jgi:hypothetical protein
MSWPKRTASQIEVVVTLTALSSWVYHGLCGDIPRCEAVDAVAVLYDRACRLMGGD